MIGDEKLQRIADECDDMALDAVWFCVSSPFGPERYLPHAEATFDERRDAFLWLLHKLLSDGRIRLLEPRKSTPLIGTIDEQVQQFRDALPKCEADLDRGIWFLTDACPAAADWRR